MMRLLVLALAACHAGAATGPHPPSTPPFTRIEAAVATWAHALQSGDDAALARTVDGEGQFALVYGAIKKAASHVPGGAPAVEDTMAGLLGLTALQILAPGLFGPPFETFYAVLPTGPLGPALVEAGLATRLDDGREVAIVPLPWDQTLGRIDQAQEQHRATLRARAAWTCRPLTIERTLEAGDRGLVGMAQVSQNIFADWLRRVERLWLVRADCDGGPALFVVTAFLDGSDRVLLATGPRTVEELSAHAPHSLAMTSDPRPISAHVPDGRRQARSPAALR